MADEHSEGMQALVLETLEYALVSDPGVGTNRLLKKNLLLGLFFTNLNMVDHDTSKKYMNKDVK